MKNISNLHEYQKRAIDFIINKKKGMLIIDIGLGKTIIALTILNHFFKQGIIKNALIIAPIKTIENTWIKEASNWNHTKNLKFINLAISQPARDNRWSLNHHGQFIHIINPELLKWLVSKTSPDHARKVSGGYDYLILDESSKFKSAKTQQFSMIKKIQYKNSLLLTATPMCNSYTDLWSQIYILDRGQRLGAYFTHYTDKYFTLRDKWTHRVYQIQKDKLDELRSRLQDVIFTVSKTQNSSSLFKGIEESQNPSDVKINYKKMIIPVTPTYKECYLEAVKESLLSIENHGQKINLTSIVEVITKLSQIASGFFYYYPPEIDISEEKKPISLRKIELVHSQKLIALKKYIIENYNKQIIIICNFIENQKQIKKMIQTDFPQKKVKSISREGKESNEWNEKKLDYLLVNSKQNMHGLNLQFGGYEIIWYGMTWSLEQYIQINGRLARQGQEKEVNITHFLMDKVIDLGMGMPDDEVNFTQSIDQTIFYRIKTKDKTQTEFIRNLVNISQSNKKELKSQFALSLF